jgi:hypothetical protein
MSRAGEYCQRSFTSNGAIQQSLAADGAIACFSSNLVSFSLNADRAPQLKASVRRLHLGVTQAFVMRKLAASILFAIAGVLALLEFIALTDPVGTKMADDLDPFGDPHMAWYQHAAFILVTIALASIGCWLWRATAKNEGGKIG